MRIDLNLPMLKAVTDKATEPLSLETVNKALEANEVKYLNGGIDGRTYVSRKKMFESLIPAFIPVYEDFIY